MPRTWAFTRPSSMIFKLLETFFYIIISNTESLIYLSMMMSMYQNAGLISIGYPMMIFGYALFEETRPRKEFWELVRKYTMSLLFFKFIVNLSILESVFEHPNFKLFSAYVRLGVIDYPDFLNLLFYMIPEILVIILIALNEIHLRLIGLFYQTEEDIEVVTDGIQRNIEQGDAE
jgi:hypothetical protein